MLFGDGRVPMDATGWAVVVVAAIGAMGSVILQSLHMYLSYKRDLAIRGEVHGVAKATNGITEKIVAAELTAERIVVRAREEASKLLATAAKTANELAPLVVDRADEMHKAIKESAEREKRHNDANVANLQELRALLLKVIAERQGREPDVH